MTGELLNSFELVLSTSYVKLTLSEALTELGAQAGSLTWLVVDAIWLLRGIVNCGCPHNFMCPEAPETQ